MFENFFKNYFNPEGITNPDLIEPVSPGAFMLCVGCAILCGLILTACYIFRTRHTRSFAATLAMLPAVVAVVIMVVNGNLGAGVAVAGAFSLVRFRSVPGTAREIGALFMAMGAGLVAGMGYFGYALVISVLFGAISIAYNFISAHLVKKTPRYKTIRITIPEDLDYTDVFDPILKKYTANYELIQVKTTNLGSLFRITYQITLKSGANEKDMIDELRIRNGNLEISISNQETVSTEL